MTSRSCQTKSPMPPVYRGHGAVFSMSSYQVFSPYHENETPHKSLRCARHSNRIYEITLAGLLTSGSSEPSHLPDPIWTVDCLRYSYPVTAAGPSPILTRFPIKPIPNWKRNVHQRSICMLIYTSYLTSVKHFLVFFVTPDECEYFTLNHPTFRVTRRRSNHSLFKSINKIISPYCPYRIEQQIH